jgi:hypothetical protein
MGVARVDFDPLQKGAYLESQRHGAEGDVQQMSMRFIGLGRGRTRSRQCGEKGIEAGKRCNQSETRSKKRIVVIELLEHLLSRWSPHRLHLS